METILAFVVVVAVIIFGALVSMGNERQRKAIDNLREQTELWAMQDLRIKRTRLAYNLRVDDPLEWLNRTVAKIMGRDLDLQVVEILEDPKALMCSAGESGTKALFTLLSPREIARLKQEKRTRLSHYTNGNPLLSLPRHIHVYEFSVLNSGLLFDLELPLVWKGLAGQGGESMERLWMYVL